MEKQFETLDVTPTWSDLLPAMLTRWAELREQQFDGKLDSNDRRIASDAMHTIYLEFKKMAKAADLANKVFTGTAPVEKERINYIIRNARGKYLGKDRRGLLLWVDKKENAFRYDDKEKAERIAAMRIVKCEVLPVS